MSTTNPESSSTSSSKKPGFFRRLFAKLDEAVKAKAEKAGSCCGSDDGKGKGGKCC